MDHHSCKEFVLINTKFGPSWMDPMQNFSCHDKLPADKKEAFKFRVRAIRFWISPTGDLYKKSYLEPYQQALANGGRTAIKDLQTHSNKQSQRSLIQDRQKSKSSRKI